MLGLEKSIGYVYVEVTCVCVRVHTCFEIKGIKNFPSFSKAQNSKKEKSHSSYYWVLTVTRLT